MVNVGRVVISWGWQARLFQHGTVHKEVVSGKVHSGPGWARQSRDVAQGHWSVDCCGSPAVVCLTVDCLSLAGG